MIEVRASYLVRMKDVNSAIHLLRRLREETFPALGWRCRGQQMLHGRAQQSTFVWSSEWADLAAWQAGMSAAFADERFQQAHAEWLTLVAYGADSEVFDVVEPAQSIDSTPGGVEVRSSYVIPIENVARAREIARRGQETIWPLLDWSGQNQQKVHGSRAGSTFVWSSVWPNLGSWEAGMARTGIPEFQTWFADWRGCVEFGAEREIFKNL